MIRGRPADFTVPFFFFFYFFFLVLHLLIFLFYLLLFHLFTCLSTSILHASHIYSPNCLSCPGIFTHSLTHSFIHSFIHWRLPLVFSSRLGVLAGVLARSINASLGLHSHYQSINQRRVCPIDLNSCFTVGPNLPGRKNISD